MINSKSFVEKMADDSFSALDGDVVIDKKTKKKERKKNTSEFSSTKLSVKNLPDDCTNEMLAAVFGDCPGVKMAFVVTEKKTVRPCGCYLFVFSFCLSNQQGGQDRASKCTGNGFIQFGSEKEARFVCFIHLHFCFFDLFFSLVQASVGQNAEPQVHGAKAVVVVCQAQVASKSGVG
jgi:RNA recognition motif-containing protein